MQVSSPYVQQGEDTQQKECLISKEIDLGLQNNLDLILQIILCN